MTELGHRPFPQTRLSIVESLRADDAETRTRAYGAIVESYWRPVYSYLRLQWHSSDEDARDLTQSFFARAIERSDFADFDPSRAHFRTYLRVCLDRFAANEVKAARRVKRGGATAILSLDFDDAATEFHNVELVDERSPDELFRREWVRRLFTLAVADVEAWAERTGKPNAFVIFERYDLDEASERVTYARLASDLGIAVTDVTNWLAASRREFRRAVLARLRETCASDAEFRAEARSLLGEGVV